LEMASSGKLIELVAGMFGLPKDGVAYAWRRLREEGVIITAGRGRSAPPVSALDAAHLVIATVADLPPKDTIEAWRTYAQAKALFLDPRTGDLGSLSWSFKHSELAGFDVPALTNLPAGHTFAEALAALITAASDGSLEEFVEIVEGSRIRIAFDSHGPFAVIYLSSLRYDLAVDYIPESNESLGGNFYLHSRRAFEYPALIKIGELIASDERGKQ
jgi:hypothetical protein